MELLTAEQARQISKNTIIKNDIEYILQKIMKDANKGEYHIYISKAELLETSSIDKIQELGYNVYLNGGMYKITW